MSPVSSNCLLMDYFTMQTAELAIFPSQLGIALEEKVANKSESHFHRRARGARAINLLCGKFPLERAATLSPRKFPFEIMRANAKTGLKWTFQTRVGRGFEQR